MAGKQKYTTFYDSKAWSVQIISRRSVRGIRSPLVKKLSEALLSSPISKTLPPQINEVSFVFTNDTEILSLNAAYRGKNKPTDVLSFSHIEGLKVESWERSLGEIVISIDTAKRQAKKYNVSLSQEIFRLIIHGLLHLLGYDHENVSPRTAQTMRRLEKRLRGEFKQYADQIC